MLLMARAVNGPLGDLMRMNKNCNIFSCKITKCRKTVVTKVVAKRSHVIIFLMYQCLVSPNNIVSSTDNAIAYIYYIVHNYSKASNILFFTNIFRTNNITLSLTILIYTNVLLCLPKNMPFLKNILFVTKRSKQQKENREFFFINFL